MTINHNKLKEANVLYINRFTVEFLKRFIQIFYKGFIWRGGLERLDELLMMLLPDYFGYTQEIVKKISQKYPDKFENKHVKEILPDIIHRTHFDLDSYQEQESLKIFRDITIEHLDRICLPKVSPLNTFEKAEKKLSKYLGLKKYQIKLITTLHILKKYNNFDEMLNCCNFYDIENIEKMCTCIGFKIEEYIEAKNILLEIGIFRLDDNDRISLSIHRLYDPYDSSEPSSWYDTLKNETLPLNSFQIDKRNINLLRQMLNNELKQPVNILLYGEPGTGKTTLVCSMAKELGITVFNVKSSINKNDYDRRLSLYTCVNLASKFNGNALILVDEAERLLDTSIRIDNQDKDKAWLNSFIENSKVSIVWITNDISFVDPAVRRRFDFSLYFPLLDKKQRLKLWNKVLTKYDATRLISRNSLSTLNELFEVPVSVMDRSINYAKKLASGNREFSSILKIQLESYISLKEDGLDINEFYKNNKKTDKDKMLEYTTDGVNFNCDIELFIDGVKRMDSYIKKSKKPKTGCGTMLFYGPPGTGKTELAKYVAKLTKRKAVIKKASDLKDCWVGSTERNIAEAFGNLDIKKELLVIDEVDSFLYDRSIAVRSWESGFVNEFLTQLQEFRGILICTTNNYEGLDPAVMRRFSFKLGFNYSEGEQSEALFNSILMPISGKALSPSEREELLSMKNLTPGDFHVVEDKFCSFFTVSKNAGNKELLKALQEELKLKKDASLKSRHIGFI